MGPRVAADLTVLVVDDDPSDVQLLQGMLESVRGRSISILSCQTAAQCREMTAQVAIDLVFLDYALDAASGLGIARALKEADPDAWIVILTQRGDEHITADIVRWGANDYLAKEELTSVRVRQIVEQAVNRASHTREKKHAESVLKLNEKNFRALIDSIPDVVLVHRGGIILFANQASQAILGYSEQEEIGKRLLDFIPLAQDKELVAANMERRGRGEEPPDYEVRVVDKRGDLHTVIVRVSRTMFNDEPAFQVMLVDITQRKKMEEDLLKAQKLESLGILAGGIAHDFNNILTGIAAGVATAKMKVSPDSAVHEILREIEAAAFKASELTLELLTFSKGGTPIRKPASVRTIIEETMRFSFRGHDVQCVADLPPAILTVTVDKSQIAQVFNNLFLNACQAMPSGGTVTVSCRNVSVGTCPQKPPAAKVTPVKRALPLKEGLYVEVRVADTGAGIPQANLQKVFDPYFTTKPRGSGLGLTIVHTVLQKHDGHVSVESIEGKGTTFTLYLPAEPAVWSDAPAAQVRVSGSGNILVMDDEHSVRSALEKLLPALGFRVTAVSNSEEALAAYQKARETADPYSLVLMDLTMAVGLGGRETMEKLLLIDPGVRAIVMSGYSSDPVLANYKKHGFAGVMRKPFRVDDLSALVKEVLQS